MNTIKFPAEYNQVMPYLIVKDAAGAMRFMTTVLGATEKMRRMGEDGKTVMHGEMYVGNSVIMLAEASDTYPPDTAGMFVYVPDVDAAYERSLSMGAQSIMAPANQPYGRSCGVKDVQGNTWWITTHIETA